MRDSITNILPKIKRSLKKVPLEAIYAVSIVCVGLTSFGFGYLAGSDAHRGSVQTYYDACLTTDPHVILEGKVVASWKGTKYHYPWCPGAQQMSSTNKRWFKTIADAQKAGYAPASNCEGLE